MLGASLWNKCRLTCAACLASSRLRLPSGFVAQLGTSVPSWAVSTCVLLCVCLLTRLCIEPDRPAAGRDFLTYSSVIQPCVPSPALVIGDDRIPWDTMIPDDQGGGIRGVSGCSASGWSGLNVTQKCLNITRAQHESYETGYSSHPGTVCQLKTFYVLWSNLTYPRYHAVALNLE